MPLHERGPKRKCLRSQGEKEKNAQRTARKPRKTRTRGREQDMHLVSFSAPAVGGGTFRKTLDAVCPGTRIYVAGDIITLEVKGRTYTVGIERRLEDKHGIIGKLNPHQPLAVRRLLIEEYDYTGEPTCNHPHGYTPRRAMEAVYHCW